MKYACARESTAAMFLLCGLRCCQDVGVFGPLKVREVLALNNLKKQSLIFQRLLDIAVQDKEPVLEGKAW